MGSRQPATGLMATALAAMVQRSGSWLGQLQSRLNASLQRTVSDGLHGLERFVPPPLNPGCSIARRNLRIALAAAGQVRRRSGYNLAKHPCGSGRWPLDAQPGGSSKAEVLATTLLLATALALRVPSCKPSAYAGRPACL